MTSAAVRVASLMTVWARGLGSRGRSRVAARLALTRRMGAESAAVGLAATVRSWRARRPEKCGAGWRVTVPVRVAWPTWPDQGRWNWAGRLARRVFLLRGRG